MLQLRKKSKLSNESIGDAKLKAPRPQLPITSPTFSTNPTAFTERVPY